jgi:hypothetical protein
MKQVRLGTKRTLVLRTENGCENVKFGFGGFMIAMVIRE